MRERAQTRRKSGRARVEGAADRRQQRFALRHLGLRELDALGQQHARRPGGGGGQPIQRLLRLCLPGFLLRGQRFERTGLVVQIARPGQRSRQNQTQPQRQLTQAERKTLLKQQRVDEIDLLAHGWVSSMRNAAPIA